MVFRSVFLGLISLLLISCASLRPVSRPDMGSTNSNGTAQSSPSGSPQPYVAQSPFPTFATSNEKVQVQQVPLSTAKEIQEFSAGSPGVYIIGPGDVLFLKSLSKNFSDERLKVAPDGTISVTTNGGLRVASLDLVTAEREINLALARQFDNFEIKLSLETAVNRKVIILGDVVSPGVVLLDGDISVLEAIARAGGMVKVTEGLRPSPDRLRLECRIVRANGKSVWLDLGRALFQNDQKQNPLLRNSDLVYVYCHD